MPVFNRFYEKQVKELWLNKPIFEIDGKKYYRMPGGCIPPAIPTLKPERGVKLSSINDKEKDKDE